MMANTEMCKCEKCFLDVCALVFNSRYSRFVTPNRATAAKVPEMSLANRVEMTVSSRRPCIWCAIFPALSHRTGAVPRRLPTRSYMRIRPPARNGFLAVSKAPGLPVYYLDAPVAKAGRFFVLSNFLKGADPYDAAADPAVCGEARRTRRSRPARGLRPFVRRVGIASNTLLFAVKLLTGLFYRQHRHHGRRGEQPSDSASSLLTVIAFKLSSMPADEEHPWGHARFEYNQRAGRLCLVFVIGVQFLISSVKKILAARARAVHPHGGPAAPAFHRAQAVCSRCFTAAWAGASPPRRCLPPPRTSATM
jgi:hypothetical protein